MTVGFTSKIVAGSVGLTDTTLTAQPVSVTGKVYNYAAANTLPTTPIDLGNIHAGGSFISQNVLVRNMTADNGGFAESLLARSGSGDTPIVPGGSAKSDSWDQRERRRRSEDCRACRSPSPRRRSPAAV